MCDSVGVSKQHIKSNVEVIEIVCFRAPVCWLGRKWLGQKFMKLERFRLSKVFTPPSTFHPERITLARIIASFVCSFCDIYSDLKDQAS